MPNAYNALSKAIKTRIEIENVHYVKFRLNLKHYQTNGLHIKFKYVG